jgi:hypothetical protein
MAGVAGSGSGRRLRALAALGLSLALGCAAFDHALQAKHYVGTPLSPRSAKGAQRLDAELAIDATLRRYVEKNGRPDYFYVVDRQKLYFFYVEADRATMFERVLVEGSHATELGRIPGRLLKLLPMKTRSQVEARRVSIQRRAQASARQTKRQIARTKPRLAPASRAPGGTYIGGFDVDQIVARLRPPMTAADPGIPNWRRSKLRNGAHAYSAKAGSTRYEVTLERVAFTVRVSASRKHLPPSARLAMQRVNEAVFAAKADAVTQKMIELASRAVADRSGRTAFHERIAGRTIRVGRRVDLGVLTYSIHP